MYIPSVATLMLLKVLLTLSSLSECIMDIYFIIISADAELIAIGTVHILSNNNDILPSIELYSNVIIALVKMLITIVVVDIT